MTISRSLSLAVLLSIGAASAAMPGSPGFHVTENNAAWTNILHAFGLQPMAAGEARVVVVLGQAANAPQQWLAKADAGQVLVLEGDSPLARALGFVPGSRTVRVTKIRDTRYRNLRISWEDALRVPVFRVPKEARVLSLTRNGDTPLMATLRRGNGAVLWVAASPGEEGFERFPHLPQALIELGVAPPFESRRLWAFFDPAYRLKLSEELFVTWRKSGIAALQVATWNNFEPDSEYNDYMQELIAGCHRHNILVYAWLELPHVSDRFWNQHPEWREKTAQLKDAYVPWRRLMNLANPDCHRAVAAGVRDLMSRFDWDGLNFAELYFDGVMGIANEEEFTPLNDDVRAEVKKLYGFDPIDLFRGRRDQKKLRTFLDYRADLAARLQANWVAEMEKLRKEKPGLDLVLTYVDDRFDTTMRDAIGADAARSLKVLDQHPMTFLVEDPATVWHLGPKRYHEIGEKYRPLTKHQELLAVDINFVERNKDQHPTRLQTGVELMQLIRAASESFARVAFYSESTVLPADLPLLAPASAVVSRCEIRNGEMTIESPYGVGVRWNGPTHVDGRPWPVRNDTFTWLPPGRHLVKGTDSAPPVSLLDFNGSLTSAAVTSGGIELEYRDTARALALFSRKPVRLALDGAAAKIDLIGQLDAAWVLRLPAGEHRAVVGFE